MRKFLLSTSTLAGAALLSSVAAADVSISGTMEWEMINGDTDAAATDGTAMTIMNEVGIDFTNQTDSGLTITLNTDLDTDSGGVDDNSMSISGGFGKIVVGETDGAEDAYAIHAAALVAEEHNMSATLDTDNDIMTATGAQQTGNGNKISYHLPAMGGLTAGASFQDSGYNTSTDLTEFGAQYAMEAGGAAVTIGYTTATQEGATKDTDSTTLGVKIVTGALSIIANQATVDSATDDETGNSFGLSYSLPNGMTLGASTMTAEDDGATDLGEEYSVNHYELTYPVASGLSIVMNVSDYDYKTGTGNTEKTADSGTYSSVMLKASF